MALVNLKMSRTSSSLNPDLIAAHVASESVKGSITEACVQGRFQENVAGDSLGTATKRILSEGERRKRFCSMLIELCTLQISEKREISVSKLEPKWLR